MVASIILDFLLLHKYRQASFVIRSSSYYPKQEIILIFNYHYMYMYIILKKGFS